MKNEILFGKHQECRQPHPIPELTLEDIAPQWAARLEKVQNRFPFLMSLTWLKWYRELKYTSKCVVGEAHGHSSRYVYSCDECANIGFKFMYYFLLNWHRKLEQNKQRFVKHWNEKHRKNYLNNL
jgi:hypothetical protein